jgi:predicted permease
MFDNLLNDLKYAARLLAKEPILTLAAALSIALGVAPNTTVFTIANKALLRGIPAGDPETLVSVYGQHKGQSPGETISRPDFDDLAAMKEIFEDAACYFSILPANIRDKDARPMRLWGQLVTPNYFRVAKVTPRYGRTFAEGEGVTPGKDQVVVLSHHLWRDKLGADPSIVGREILLNRRKFTVIGIAAEGFRGMDVGLSTDFWVPMSLASQLMPNGENEFRDTKRGTFWLNGIARLRPGVTLEKARAAVQVLNDRLAKEYPDTNKQSALYIEKAGQLNPAARGPAIAFFALLLVVMTLVLLIACANVANLLLARAAARQREIATRLAIGAGRGRLIRQLLTESLLLAALGGGMAVLMTEWLANLIANVQLPIPVPVDFKTGVDWRVAAFSLLLTLLTGVVFGLVPALRATRQDLAGGLRVHAADAFGSARRFSLGNLLVGAQVAAAALLLIGSALFLRSLQSVHSIDLGLNPNNLLILTIDPALDGKSKQQTVQTLAALRNRVAEIPGVTAVSYTDMMPLMFGGQASSVETPEQHASKDKTKTVIADFASVGEQYLPAMGIKLEAGEGNLRERAGTPAAVVNRAFVDQMFPNQSPIGRTFHRGRHQYEIIGVAANSKIRSVGESPRPAMYIPVDEEGANAILGFRLLVRTTGAPQAIAPVIQQTMRQQFPDVSVYDTQTMQDHVANAQILPRMAAWIFGFAGAASLVLAVVGLFGVVSYSVSRRYREIGIRMALGANPVIILRWILAHGLRVTLIGAALGVVAAAAGTRVLSNLLYGVSATDPVSFGIVPVLLLSVALVACLVPALRASRMDPQSVLREE